MIVGRPRAHLGAVGGKPGDFVSGFEAGFGEDFAEQEDALAAKTGDFDADVEGQKGWLAGESACPTSRPRELR